MPKVLTEAQVRALERDEARVADIKKMKTKSYLLCPWMLEIAEDPHILDVFEDLIGPDIRCWSRYGPSEAYGGKRPAT